MLIILLSLVSTLARAAGCDFHHIQDEKSALPGLSPYWAQDQIGADLAKERMDQLRSTVPLRTVYVTDVDGGVDKQNVRADLIGRAALKMSQFGDAQDHGNSVLDILAGRGRFGIGHADFVKISDIIVATDPPGTRPELIGMYTIPSHVAPASAEEEKILYRQALNSYRAVRVDRLEPQLKRANADVISVEIHTLAALNSSHNAQLNKTFDALARRSIIVAAAGNNYGQDDAEGKKLLNNTNVIVVGSSHPTGLASAFSSTSKDLSIVAPADMAQYAWNPANNNLFGGTSGAEPMVSGSLANAAAFLKPLGAADARKILEVTATPIAYGGDGKGMVNAYRLVAYAARLREAGWPKNKDKLLNDGRLADFSADAAKKLAEGRRLLAYPNCSLRELALKNFRQAFLLNPNSDSAREIAKLYGESAYRNDAKFYELYAASPIERKSLAARWSKFTMTGDKSLTPEFVERNANFFGTGGAR